MSANGARSLSARLQRAARGAPRPRSFMGELALWSFLAILPVSVALTTISSVLAARRSAETLTDVAMVEFLDTEIRPRLAACGGVGAPAGPRDACEAEITAQESGGVWRVAFSNGRSTASLTFAPIVGGRSAQDAARFLSACDWSGRRRLQNYELATCSRDFETTTERYRVLRNSEDAGSGQGPTMLLLEDAVWTGRVDATVRLVAWGGAATTAAFVSAATLAAALLLMRRRLARQFARVQHDVDRVRLGETIRLSNEYPREVDDLAQAFNAALDAASRQSERQRRHVKKMAHDLRHKLVALDRAAQSNEMTAMRDGLAGLGVITERYLQLMDWSGPAETRNWIAVEPTVERAQTAFQLLFRPAPLTFETDIEPGLEARLASADLEILLSNLLSNAHKHAKSIIRISARSDAGRLTLKIEDDGPGIPPEDRARALAWGGRLDQTAPGSGFGLAIVAEQINELYRGQVHLDASELGGLRVHVHIPQSARIAA